MTEIERLTAERDESRSMADQANSLVDSLREERAADLARAYDTGHHHAALGITEIPAEYRQPVETTAEDLDKSEHGGLGLSEKQHAEIADILKGNK